MLALGVAPALGQLVGLGAIDATQVGEKQQPAVGGGDEEVVDDVVFAQGRALDPLAKRVLRLISI